MADADDPEAPLPATRLALETRVALTERDVRAHSRSITELVLNDQKQSASLKELEEWKLTRLLAEAREDERDKALGDRLGRIENSIEKGIAAAIAEVNAIKGNFSKAFWIAMGTIIPAVILGVALILVFGTNMIPKP